MKVTYSGPFDAIELASGEVFENGKETEVSDSVGAELVKQAHFNTNDKNPVNLGKDK